MVRSECERFPAILASDQSTDPRTESTWGAAGRSHGTEVPRTDSRRSRFAWLARVDLRTS